MVIKADGPGINDWVVQAEWMGAVRTVFRGDIFACCAFRAENSE
jgi:hypothetical protein